MNTNLKHFLKVIQIKNYHENDSKLSFKIETNVFNITFISVTKFYFIFIIINTF